MISEKSSGCHEGTWVEKMITDCQTCYINVLNYGVGREICVDCDLLTC